MKLADAMAHGGWSLLLALAACGGTTIETQGTDPKNAQVGRSGSAAGSGGAGGYDVTGTGAQPGKPSPSLPSGSPNGCAGGARPTVFAQPGRIVGMSIALSATDVYWNDGSAIVRQSKAGGAPQAAVANLPPNSARVAASAERLFWEQSREVVTTPIAAPSEGASVARRLSTGNWSPGGDELYYLVDPTSGVGGTSAFDPTLPGTIEVASMSGATPPPGVTLAAPSALGPFAADATGAYWAYNQRNDPAVPIGGSGAGGGNAAPGSRIQKLDAATHEVSDFAPVGVVNPGNLQSDGEWVVWADDNGSSTIIMQSKPDGSMQGGVGSAELVRGIAVYGSTVYWAASHPGDVNSDIYSAPLGPKSTPRLIACQVPDIDGLKADASDIYYFTYTDPPIIGRLPRL